MAKPIRPLAERFENSVMKDPNSGCWLWTDLITEYGYGRLHHEGEMRKAHRISYEYHVGPIPSGMLVCHKCDIPACVNPDHLFLGTQNDNVADKIKKGRGRAAKGEDSGRAKLTWPDVREIRTLPMTQKELSKRFGVSPSVISNIRQNKYWIE